MDDRSARDTEAVEAFRAGRREAFDDLVERHRDRIYGLALRVTGSADDALDVTQDAFAKALTKLDRLDDPRYFGTWLYRIALNTAISSLRRDERTAASEDPQVLAQRVSADDSPEGELDSAERAALVHRALAELPAGQRAAVALCDLEGHSYEAIARLLDISIGTVMSRIHYGRKKLREKLERWL